ncbi:MAG: HAD hydrolase family protein [Deltaproteobacteria bacterium]|jgi:3-deoxy-D-manno-octulosonate 8-phosphate phosphatase (KDO 8-P phosphatase)|nr:HAD hydrolase family protein [Deltaproteobacteria bacterium]
MRKPPNPFPNLKWIGFDVDGVMTDGGIIINDQGVESKRFNSRDGFGIKQLVKAGLRVAIITGRISGVVEHRAKEMGVTEVHQKALNKLDVYDQVLRSSGLRPEETAFAGDDIVDLPILIRCGLAMAPSDADPEVLSRVHLVTQAKGGHGAVREMVEYVLTGLGLWPDVLAHYLDPKF